MKMFEEVLLITVVAVTASAKEFVKWEGNGHFYKAVYASGGISWSKAKAAAERAGGYLATVTSSKENDFIFNLIDEDRYWNICVSDYGKENLGPWIGGYQEEGTNAPKDGWKWVTGEKFRYEKWASGEPTGIWAGRNEDRLHYYNLGRRKKYWNDLPDSMRKYPIFGYVIEKDDDS